MAVSTTQIKELREKSGAGMLDCKKALEETDGDIEKAIDLLREKGLAAAAKRSGKAATEGVVDSYIHDGKIGVLVEVNSETDFVARNDEFRALVHDIAMQVAAMNPMYVSPDDVPEDEVEREKEVLRAQARESGKPDDIIEKMIVGRMKKFYAEICLLEQPFVKDDKKTVGEMVKELAGKIGENLTVRRFVRFGLGEGLEKKQDDFAAEVAAAVSGD